MELHIRRLSPICLYVRTERHGPLIKSPAEELSQDTQDNESIAEGADS